ncbi:MAG: CBS domain-containing protein [Syntrophomonadaceae bacterium]|nr:CBS domain-containing protein [Syntrophomonadaceae bacterium]MDH7498637.1 CBS domain-containing protein [Syntrophomonadaceae bacterium]
MKVRDRMTSEVITVRARVSLQEALHIMREHNFRRLPVVESGRLVGMVVQHDIEKALRQPGMVPEAPVEWVMTRDPLSIGPDDDIVLAALLLKDHKISGLPVMEDGRLVGIITDTDLLQAFIEVMQNR